MVTMSQNSDEQPKPTDLLKSGQDCFFTDPPDYEKAEYYFLAGLKIRPNSGELYHWLGCTLEHQTKYVEAIEAYKSAITLLRDDPRPLIALGSALHSAGHSAEAIEPIEAGLALHPSYCEADAFLLLGEIFESIGKIKDAVRVWQKVLTIGSCYPSYELPKLEAQKKLAIHINGRSDI